MDERDKKIAEALTKARDYLSAGVAEADLQNGSEHTIAALLTSWTKAAIVMIEAAAPPD